MIFRSKIEILTGN